MIWICDLHDQKRSTDFDNFEKFDFFYFNSSERKCPLQDRLHWN